MTMFTRCTSCGAVFRVTLEHLQASAGQVRCGVCETVFDAFVSLTASDPRGDGTLAPETAPTGFAPGRERQTAQAVERRADGARRLAEPARAQGSGGAEHGTEVPKTAAQARLHAPPPPPAVGLDGASPAERRGGGLSAALVGLLVFAAVLQGTYFLRAELAAYAPVLRPWLEQACLPLGCSVSLPRATEQLSIEGSDLRALDPARPGRVLLTATIRNRAPFTQAWPLLELTLTNVRDEAVIRRAFSAAEYLAPAAPGAGIGPGAEATVRMRLEAQDMEPVGYRLYLFHP